MNTINPPEDSLSISELAKRVVSALLGAVAVTFLGDPEAFDKTKKPKDL